MAIGLITYQDTIRAEDVVDVVTNISPKSTPLLSGLGMAADATNTLHEYLTDTFASAGDNAGAEAAAFTAVDLTQPTRIVNKTQIFKDDILVSGTEVAVKGYAGDPFEYQIEKNLTEHAKDIELALMVGTTASGSSGVARRLAGVIAGISTVATARASGSSLGEVIYNDLINNIYNQTDEVADEVYVGGTLKRDISGFTASNTKNVDASDKRLINAVDVYVSDFGMQKVFLHRDVPTGANAKAIVAINSNFWKIAFLKGRKTKVTRLTSDGDRERAMVISELTLENLGEKASGKITGFTL